MSALLTPPAPAAAPPALLTADEFFDRYQDGGYDLVDGVLVEMPMPGGTHGQVCVNVGFELKLYLRSNPIGRAFGNAPPLRPMLVADVPAKGLAASAPPSATGVSNNHLAYAVQWFLFAAIALIIYAIALWRRAKV